MIRLHFFLMVFIFGLQPMCAQDFLNKDSLWMEMKKSKPDTNRVLLFIQLGQQYENNDPDSAIALYENALHLSQKLNYLLGVIKYYNNVTYVYNVLGKYDTALFLNLKAVEIATQYGNQKRLAACLANVGASYTMLLKHDKAIEYFLQALKIVQPLNDKGYLQILYGNLTNLYGDIEQPAKAIEFGEKGLAMAYETNNIHAQLLSLVNLSVAYTKIGELEKALKYSNEALPLAKKVENDVALAAVLQNISSLYTRFGDFKNVKKYCEESLQLAEKLQDTESITIALRGLAVYYLATGNSIEAELYAQRSLKIALQNNFRDHIKDAYLVLSDIALVKNNWKNSSAYRLRYDSLDDLTFNESMAKNIQELEVRYESEKKELQIKQLNQEAAIQEFSLKQTRMTVFILTIILIALGVISFLTWRTYQQKKEIMAREHMLDQQKIGELEMERQLTASKAVIQGQEQERGRLAKDLHDGLGGLLSGVKISLSNMKGNLVMTGDNVLVFERSLDMLDNSILELRRVSHNMMPESLIKFGLTAALRDFCESINAMKALVVTFQTVGVERKLDSTQEIILYRIVQELINNTLKHSGAKNALIQFMFEPSLLSVTIEDDGQGFEKSLLESTMGSGWANIKSRVEYLKGKLDVTTRPSEGTSVHIQLPL